MPFLPAPKQLQACRAVLPVVFAVLVCGIVLLVIWATILNALNEWFPGCSADDPEAIEQLARFELPPSASNLECSYFGIQGYGADATFEMSPDDLERFVASTEITAPLSPELALPDDFRFPHLTIEDVRSMSSYLYGIAELTYFTQQVIIDTSDPDRYVVYIYALGGD